jgi:hypothetical protein
MSATSFTLKKGQNRAVNAYYLRPLEKSRYRAWCFLWKCKGWSLDIVIDNDRGRGNDLCLRVFEKVWSFTHLGRRLGIRSMSGIRPTCQCWCPPLPQELRYITSADLERARGNCLLLPYISCSFLHMALIKRIMLSWYKISFEKSNIGSKMIRCKTL